MVIVYYFFIVISGFIPIPARSYRKLLRILSRVIITLHKIAATMFYIGKVLGGPRRAAYLPY